VSYFLPFILSFKEFLIIKAIKIRKTIYALFYLRIELYVPSFLAILGFITGVFATV